MSVTLTHERARPDARVNADACCAADLDAYALALERLLSAVDRHARGPLHDNLARAIHDARELLTEDQRIV